MDFHTAAGGQVLGEGDLAPDHKNSNRKGSLPLPETNPLLNPVLAAHMGKWAEVYFTAPPERREEAVLGLLRQLQGDAASPLPSHGTPERPVPGSATLPPDPNPLAEADPGWIVCASCGGRNVAGNRYCGMCAEALQAAKTTPVQPPTVLPPRLTMWGGADEPDSSGDGRHPAAEESAPNESQGHEMNAGSADRYQADLYPANAYQSDQPEESDTEWKSDIRRERDPDNYMDAAAEGQELQRDEWAGNDWLRNDALRNQWLARPDITSLGAKYVADQEAPQRRRRYAGAIAGLVILGLLYLGWKAYAGRSGFLHSTAQPVPANPVATVEEAPPVPNEQAPASRAEPGPVPASKSPAPAEQRPVDSTSSVHRNPAAPSAATGAQTPDQTPRLAVAPLPGNGAEELAVAESYLKGTRGKTRDPGEAAKWLWRSFGKKNGAAALLLSDLYVGGDGVPQSCDQARLLLNAAARNGTPGAAERQHSLPSRGCP